MCASGLCEGAHGITEIRECAPTIQCVGGKPGQGYAAVLIVKRKSAGVKKDENRQGNFNR